MKSDNEKEVRKKREKREQARRERNGIYRNLTLISQFTLYMLVPIGGLSVGGYFLDKHFGTSWIIIVCFFVGAVAGGQSVYRLAMKIANEKKEEPEHHVINRRSRETSEVTPGTEEDKSRTSVSESDNDGTS